jgi:hypothetical protein
MNNYKSISKFDLSSTKIVSVEQPKKPRILSKHLKCLNQQTQNNFSDMFKIGKNLGKGRFGNVTIGKHISTHTIFAIKDIDISKMSAKLS